MWYLTNKHQKPNIKHQENIKLQIKGLKEVIIFCSLAFGVFLVFGA